MPQYCAVRFCSEKRTGHRFPKDNALSKQWVVAIRREGFIPSKYSRVCSKHFKPDDYVIPKEPTTDNPPARLKPNAVPSQFAWNHLESEERKRMKGKIAIRALPRQKLSIQNEPSIQIQQTFSLIKEEPICEEQLPFQERVCLIKEEPICEEQLPLQETVCLIKEEPICEEQLPLQETVCLIKEEPICEEQLSLEETFEVPCKDIKVEMDIESLKKDASVQCSLCDCGERSQLNKLALHIANLSKLQSNKKCKLKVVNVENLKKVPM